MLSFVQILNLSGFGDQWNMKFDVKRECGRRAGRNNEKLISVVSRERRSSHFPIYIF